MRVQKKLSRKSILTILFALIIVAIGVATAFYLVSSQGTAEPRAQELKSQPENKNTPNDTDKKAPALESSVREEEKDPLPAYEGENVNQGNDITGVINYKSVIESNLVLRTTINQALSSGTCSLVLTRQGTADSVSRTASIAPNPSSASCEGFDIPTSELSSGVWNIEITITSGDKTGTLRDSVTI